MPRVSKRSLELVRDCCYRCFVLGKVGRVLGSGAHAGQMFSSENNNVVLRMRLCCFLTARPWVYFEL